MFNIVLFEPEIPPNTGNIIRLCANTNAHLHLIEPFGFSLDNKQMRRAGLDYHQHVQIKTYPNFAAFLKTADFKRLFAIETCGERNYTDVEFSPGDAFLFGSETTKGIPQEILDQIPKNHILKIPMVPDIRSINLSNAVAITLFEAWRQNNFTV